MLLSGSTGVNKPDSVFPSCNADVLCLQVWNADRS